MATHTQVIEDYDLLIINDDIDQDVIDVVLKIDAKKISKRLAIVITTLGGSPYIAYRAMTHLQHMYRDKQIDMLVPDMAMSAGTLMCLGADKIYMHEGSCLGPLDLQVEHPTDGERISSLDIRESSYRILGLTQTVSKQFFQQARRFGLSKVDAAQLSYESAVKLFEPLVSQIDPYHLQEGYRAGPLSAKYARFLLTRSITDRAERNRIATTLAEDYQTHEYAITKDEAEYYLELQVANLTDLDIYNHVMSLYNANGKGVRYDTIRFEPPPNKNESS